MENGGKHPLGSTALMYLPRKNGRRCLKSVEDEYKLAAVKLFTNTDPIMVVREESGAKWVPVYH